MLYVAIAYPFAVPLLWRVAQACKSTREAMQAKAKKEEEERRAARLRGEIWRPR